MIFFKCSKDQTDKISTVNCQQFTLQTKNSLLHLDNYINYWKNEILAILLFYSFEQTAHTRSLPST